jgi:hypothetical protein
MTGFTEIQFSDLEKLKLPFPAEDIEWRVSRSGITNGKPWVSVLAYVTARACQNRLDEAVGPQNWEVHYTHIKEAADKTGVICHLAIRIGDSFVTKSDGAEETEFESFKGGISSAFKRAASAWGIGRYLYGLEEAWAEVHESRVPGSNYQVVRDKKSGQEMHVYWSPPELPAWALPEGSGHTPEPRASVPPQVVVPRPVAQVEKPQGASPNRPAAVTTPDAPPAGTPNRGQLTAKLMTLHRPFITNFPHPQFHELLKERYGISESRLMTLEQLTDLVAYVESRLNGLAGAMTAEAPVSVPAPVKKPSPIKAAVAAVAPAPQDLGEFMIKVNGIHKGKKFKELGPEQVQSFAQAQWAWFMANKKKPSKDWQEFFTRAEEYSLGAQPVEPSAIEDDVP